MLVDLNKFVCPEEMNNYVDEIRKDGQFLSVCRGASEIMLEKCTTYIDPNTFEIK